MYRILLADDEGIMLESLQTMLKSSYGETCEIAAAKTGRAVIELAESFHPDIVFMDIHMPGINGISAIREIRKFNSTALFYIISAYDTFDYAREAIELGVEKYLTKPISRRTFLNVMQEAVEKVEDNRKKRRDQLRIQEKLESVIPVIESGFVSTVLFQMDPGEENRYLQLLDLKEKYGYVMVIQFGSGIEDGHLVTPVGIDLQAQAFAPRLREILKSSFSCLVGPILSNRITVIVPHEKKEVFWEERNQIVESARLMASRMEERLDACFRIGIGKNHTIRELQRSYQEAARAIGEGKTRVMHIDDLQQHGVYDDAFPGDIEQDLFHALSLGNLEQMNHHLNEIYDWMIVCHAQETEIIQLKVLEYIIWAERLAFEGGAINYGFLNRKNYLHTVLSFSTLEELRVWFTERMSDICRSIRDQRESESESVIKKAQNYILEHYEQDLSLDEVSRVVNVSPYYFSKLFKEEAGENFIEYLTRIRMEKARRLLEDPTVSIKEVSILCGYPDPNYFSRIFKKQTDMSPREYKTRFGTGAGYEKK